MVHDPNSISCGFGLFMRVITRLVSSFRQTWQHLSERLGDAENLSTLLWAIPIGIVGALVTLGFRLSLIHI